ncbi:MAG: hypothetical protein GXP36_09980 [Actinobacteria bacterium]|nr:hypothetical protein [Actinomycetota bacterium]
MSEGIWSRAFRDARGHWFTSAVGPLGLAFLEATVAEIALPAEPTFADRALAFLTVAGVFAVAVYIFHLWRAPFSQRDEALQLNRELADARTRPPFRLEFRDTPPEDGGGPRLIVRHNVINHGPKGKFRAEFERVDGSRSTTARIPLEWTNRRGDREIAIEGSGTEAQLTLGEMAVSDDHARFFYFVARTPDGPGTDQIRPSAGVGWIRVTVRVVNVDTEQDASVQLIIGADANGPFAKAARSSAD